MSEKHLKRHMELAVTAQVPTARLFNNTVGQGWVGVVAKRWQDSNHSYITLRDPRPLQAGLCPDSPDHVGWVSEIITPAMVGTRVGIMCGLEAKHGKNGASKGRRNFIRAMQNAGCRAGIYYDVDEALAILRGSIKH